MSEEVQVHEPRTRKSAVFSVRFPGDELWEVRQAAQEAGVSVGEFVRRAALDRARAREVPAAFAGAIGRTLTDIWEDYKATEPPSGESVDDLLHWLRSDTTLRTDARRERQD